MGKSGEMLENLRRLMEISGNRLRCETCVFYFMCEAKKRCACKSQETTGDDKRLQETAKKPQALYS